MQNVIEENQPVVFIATVCVEEKSSAGATSGSSTFSFLIGYLFAIKVWNPRATLFN